MPGNDRDDTKVTIGQVLHRLNLQLVLFRIGSLSNRHYGKLRFELLMCLVYMFTLVCEDQHRVLELSLISSLSATYNSTY